MKKLLPVFLIALFLESLLIPAFCNAQNNVCSSAWPLCLEQDSIFPAIVNGGNAEPGAYYGCLLSRPNPSWYYMKILQSGSLLIKVRTIPMYLDVDFACWGPFTSPTDPCVEGLTAEKMIACNYLPQPLNVDTIPNGITGEYYILLITNYSNLPCDIYLYQIGGTGTLECVTTSLETQGMGNNSVSLRNFPNPCIDKTTFVFSVPRNTKAKLDIYDITGRHIQTLFDDEAIKGQDYSIDYYCKDNTCGIFIYKLTTDRNVITGKMMHINNLYSRD